MKSFISFLILVQIIFIGSMAMVSIGGDVPFPPLIKLVEVDVIFCGILGSIFCWTDWWIGR
jgi:hypothetical protein